MAAELFERGCSLGFDSLYLPPVPMRGKRNDLSNIKYIAAKVAEIKGMDSGEIEAVAMENGKRLFGME